MSEENHPIQWYLTDSAYAGGTGTEFYLRFLPAPGAVEFVQIVMQTTVYEFFISNHFWPNSASRSFVDVDGLNVAFSATSNNAFPDLRIYCSGFLDFKKIKMR